MRLGVFTGLRKNCGWGERKSRGHGRLKWELPRTGNAAWNPPCEKSSDGWTNEEALRRPGPWLAVVRFEPGIRDAETPAEKEARVNYEKAENAVGAIAAGGTLRLRAESLESLSPLPRSRPMFLKAKVFRF